MPGGICAGLFPSPATTHGVGIIDCGIAIVGISSINIIGIEGVQALGTTAVLCAREHGV